MDIDELERRLMGSPRVGHRHVQCIPAASGVYAAWLSDEAPCLYVGMAGNLRIRIRSHFSGQRGGDQFCLLVYDRYVHAERCRSDGPTATHEVKRATGEWIQQRVTFQCLELPAAETREVERQLRRTLQPILNALPRNGD